MGLATTTARVSYNGDASTTAFSWPYKYVAAADLVVYLTDEDDGGEVLQSNYTVTATGSATNGVYPGATITFTTAPSADVKVVIERDPARTQEFDFDSETEPLPVIDRYADRVAMQLQRIFADSVRLSPGSLSNHSGVLPNLIGNAGKAILCNSAEDGLTFGSGLDGVSVSSAVEAILASSTLPAFVAAQGDPAYYAAIYGVSTASSDNTSALNALIATVIAAGGGRIILPAGTTTCTGALAANGSNVTIEGQGYETSTLALTYTAAEALVLGNSTTRTNNYTFRKLKFSGPAGQTMIWPKKVTGVFFENCSWTADRFIRIGDSGTADAYTYRLHFTNCNAATQVASPTLHHLYADNFLGELIMVNSFIEGRSAANIDGFYASDNAQQRIDHIVGMGGYVSRFRYNWNFTDGRVGNAHWVGHETEGALTNCFRFETTSATAKSTSNVGYENVHINGCKLAAIGGNAIFIKNDRAVTGSSNMNICGNTYTTANTKTPIYVEAAAGTVINTTIVGQTIDFTPSSTQYFCHLVGPAGAANLKGVTVAALTGRASATLDAIVRVEGRVDALAVDIASLAVTGATIALDDQTSATPLKLTATTAAATDLAPILDQSAGWSRPMLLSELAKALENYITNDGSKTYDPSDLADGAGETTTVTCTGAALGDFAQASFSLDLQGLMLTAYVSAADTVTVRFQNETTGSVNLGSGTLRVRTRPASLA